MESIQRIVQVMASTLIGLSGCESGTSHRQTAAETIVHDDQTRKELMSGKMKVMIGKKACHATL